MTETDIVDWVEAVAPRWLWPKRAFHGYVRGWDVPGKIRAAKLAGTFEQTIAQRRKPFNARLALCAIL